MRGKREQDYIPIAALHQNNSCVKMGGDESHFNISLIVKNKVTRQGPQTATYEGKGEPKRIRTEDRLLTSLTPNDLTLNHTCSRLPLTLTRPYLVVRAVSVVGVSRFGLAVRR